MISESNIPEKQIILKLIKAEMKNFKLIRGLKNAGMVTEDFYTDLSGLIISLMGFEEESREEILRQFDKYMENLDDVAVSKFSESLNQLAHALYERLLERKITKNHP